MESLRCTAKILRNEMEVRKVIWSPTTSFLRSGSALAERAINTSATKITWKFVSHKDPLLPLHFVRCEMKGWGVESVGSAASFNQFKSHSISFAEAWERLWQIKLMNENFESKQFRNSNGFAAGNTVEMASQNSVNELIERQVVLQAWRENEGWQKHAKTSFIEKVLISGLTYKGWKISSYRIYSNAGIVSACLARSKNSKMLFESALNHGKFSIEKNLISLAKMIFFFGESKITNFELNLHGQPKDHLYFYLDPNNSKAFNFLNCNSSSDEKTILLKDATNFETLVLSDAGVFPAVAFSSNKSWSDLSWGTKSISGKNLWPHPIA